jgi:hypothetical protein
MTLVEDIRGILTNLNELLDNVVAYQKVGSSWVAITAAVYFHVDPGGTAFFNPETNQYNHIQTATLRVSSALAIMPNETLISPDSGTTIFTIKSRSVNIGQTIYRLEKVEKFTTEQATVIKRGRL